MLLTILLGAVTAHLIFPQLSVWEVESLPPFWPRQMPDWGRSLCGVHGYRCASDSHSMWSGLNDGLSVPFLMFFIAVSRIGTDGAGSVLLNYVFEQLGMGAMVGLAVGLIGGLLLGLAVVRSGWTNLFSSLVWWRYQFSAYSPANLLAEHVHCGVRCRPGCAGRFSRRRYT